MGSFAHIFKIYGTLFNHGAHAGFYERKKMTKKKLPMMFEDNFSLT
jgi:hypothetical protein